MTMAFCLQIKEILPSADGLPIATELEVKETIEGRVAGRAVELNTKPEPPVRLNPA
jgi:hypothetical protein